MTKQAAFLSGVLVMISFSSCAVSNPTAQSKQTDLDRAIPFADSSVTSIIDHTDASIVSIETQITDTILGSQTYTITDQIVNAIDVIETYPITVLDTDEMDDVDTYAFSSMTTNTSAKMEETLSQYSSFQLADIPTSNGNAYVIVNDNKPFFMLSDYPSESFEYYSPLDELGRCGECVACIGQDLMPTEKRGSIGMVKPSGWQLVRYDGIVEGNYLFNRCHLIGYQLTGENANTSNLITGTRYLNTVGMLPFENQTSQYVQSTANHVLYRVTPIFEGNNLLATGVLMEAESVEDNGEGLMFNVFYYS